MLLLQLQPVLALQVGAVVVEAQPGQQLRCLMWAGPAGLLVLETWNQKLPLCTLVAAQRLAEVCPPFSPAY
jgi:hypothetical protein